VTAYDRGIRKMKFLLKVQSVVWQFLSTMEVPYTQLSKEALANLITEFVSGTDDSGFDLSLSDKIEQVKAQLKDGSVIVTYDETSETCHLLKRDSYPSTSLKISLFNL